MYLHKENVELFALYNLVPFSMKVQSLNRTLIDKLFAVCDYYLQGKPKRNARHLYDIYKLAPHVRINGEFMELAEEVRNQRIQMGTDLAPAAPLGVDIMELVNRICDEDFYKEDYGETTLKLISDSLNYEMVREFYRELAGEIFGTKSAMTQRKQIVSSKNGVSNISL